MKHESFNHDTDLKPNQTEVSRSKYHASHIQCTSRMRQHLKPHAHTRTGRYESQGSVTKLRISSSEGTERGKIKYETETHQHETKPEHNTKTDKNTKVLKEGDKIYTREPQTNQAGLCQTGIPADCQGGGGGTDHEGTGRPGTLVES